MLHGCTQDPDDFATGTEMNAIAEAQGFFALYPQQSSSDNAEGCWTWFEAADQMRGAGEPASIVGVLDQVASTYAVDAARTYALGVSSGGAMAVILGATYPDRFAAIASGSGLEYAAATSLQAATSAESHGGPDPVTQGQAAYQAMGSAKRAVRAFVVQGSADDTVAPVNGTQVVAQWIATDDLATDGVANGNVSTTPATTTQGQVAGGHAYTVTTYVDSVTQKTLVESVVVNGMGHAWSGGSSAGSYTDPEGPNASAMAWDFFSNDVAPADAGAPLDLATVPSSDAAVALGGDASVKTIGPAEPDYGSGCDEARAPVRRPPWLVLCVLAMFGLSRRKRAR